MAEDIKSLFFCWEERKRSHKKAMVQTMGKKNFQRQKLRPARP